MKHFKIGKEIVSILSNDSTVNEYLGDKLFPLIANEGTEFPFLVYNRTGYTPASNKDYTSEIVYISINVHATTYTESLDIINAVSDALENKRTNLIERIYVTNSRESYDGNFNSFTQTIDLEIHLND